MLNALIVDDSKYQRYIIELCLAQYAQCSQAEDGEQALALFGAALRQGQPFDVVVLDILMPVLDGHAALRGMGLLQQQLGVPPEKRAKIIMLSSLDDPKNMMQAQFEEGAHAYLTKPFEDEVLVETLRNLDLIPNPLAEGLEEQEA